MLVHLLDALLPIQLPVSVSTKAAEDGSSAKRREKKRKGKNLQELAKLLALTFNIFYGPYMIKDDLIIASSKNEAEQKLELFSFQPVGV